MTLYVRIGPGAVVCLAFGDNSELEKTLAPYLTLAVVNDTDLDNIYTVAVCERRPKHEREPGGIEVKGDHFVFRFNPKYPKVAEAFLWGDLPGWQIACPLRQLFSWIVAHSGGVLLHASAIHMPEFGGAVVFAGPSGSGKSTLVGSIGNAEDTVLGDDWVIVREIETDDEFTSGRLWTVQSLYTSLKLSCEQQTFRLPDFDYNGKSIYRCRTTNHVYPVKALVLPHVASGKMLWVRPVTPFEAVKYAAPSTLLQSSGVPPDTLGVIRRFAEAVPRYDLTLSRDFLPLMRDNIGALPRQGD